MQQGDPAGFQYGVIVPHFGSGASAERLVDQAATIESYGFDSVWVRDHVVYEPHGHEDPDATHIDAFMVLTAIAARTSRLTLATGTLIPHRHPIYSAQLLASLDFLAGSGRIIAGIGLGNFDHEFDAVGMGGWDRRTVAEEQVAIWRKLWTGESVDHTGDHYAFTNVSLKPVPPPNRPIQVWYGGASPASARRAVEYCDGWLGSRIPIRSLDKRIDRMRRLADEAGQAPPTVGVVPYVSPGRTVEEAQRAFNLDPLFATCNKYYDPPPSGSYQSLEDLDGAAIAGPPDVIMEGVRRYQEHGVTHLVFDLRARFADWEDTLAALTEDVLRPLHREDGRTGDATNGR